MKNKKTIEYANELLEKDYTDEEIRNFLSQKCQKEEIEEIINIIKLKKDLSPPTSSEEKDTSIKEKKRINTESLKLATINYVSVIYSLYNVKKLAKVIFLSLIIAELISFFLFYFYFSSIDFINEFLFYFSSLIKPSILLLIFFIAKNSLQKNIPHSIQKISQEYKVNNVKKLIKRSVFFFSFFSLFLLGLLILYSLIGLFLYYEMEKNISRMWMYFSQNFFHIIIFAVITYLVSVVLFYYETNRLSKEYFHIVSNSLSQPNYSIRKILKPKIWKTIQFTISFLSGVIFVPLSSYLLLPLLEINKIIAIFIILLHIFFPIVIFLLIKKLFPFFAKSFLVLNIIGLAVWYFIIIISST